MAKSTFAAVSAFSSRVASRLSVFFLMGTSFGPSFIASFRILTSRITGINFSFSFYVVSDVLDVPVKLTYRIKGFGFINKPFSTGFGPDQHLSHLGESLLATIDHCSGPVLEVLIDLLQRLQVILGQFHLSPGEPLKGDE